MMKKTGKQSAEIASLTKKNILRSATELFAYQGFDGTSMRDIATHADVSHGLVRHYFGSKEGLWKTAINKASDHFMQIHQQLVQTKLTDMPANEVLFVLHVKTTHQVLTNPLPAKLLLSEVLIGTDRYQHLLEATDIFEDLIRPLYEQSQGLGYLTHIPMEAFSVMRSSNLLLPIISPPLASAKLKLNDISDLPVAYAHATALMHGPLLGIPPEKTSREAIEAIAAIELANLDED